MKFYITRTREDDSGAWENAIKYWLAVTKGDINPSPQTIKKCDKLLNSGRYPKEIRSFCATTTWKCKK
jgi:hypothetical protein